MKSKQEKNLDKKIKKAEKKEKQIDKKIKDLDKKEKSLDKKISKINKLKSSASKFKEEIKKSTNTAIIAAFGFLIALAWRDAITQYIDKITESAGVEGKLISAIIITIISVIGILITTKLLASEQ